MKVHADVGKDNMMSNRLQLDVEGPIFRGKGIITPIVGGFRGNLG